MLVAVFLVVFAIGVWRAIAVDTDLEHDEALYAVKARALVTDAPGSGWHVFRPPGLSVIGAPLARAGAHERGLRAVGLASGVAAVMAMYLLGRRLFDATTGVIAAGAFASVPALQFRSAQFLNDVPTTALLLVLCVIGWNRDPATLRRAMALGAVGAATFWMRYGAAAPLALLAAAWVYAQRRNPKVIVVATATFLVLIGPHLIESMARSGTPWGTVASATRASGRAYVGEGLLRYIRWFPVVLAGPVGGLLMFVGLAAAFLRRSAEVATIRALIAIALSVMAILGMTTHPETRFVLFPVGLLLLAGARAVAGVLTPGRRVNAAVAVLLAATIASGMWSHRWTVRAGSTRIGPAAAGAAIATSRGVPCVVTAFTEPEIAWTSGCRVVTFGAANRGTDATDRFVIVFEHGRYQPTGVDLAPFLAGARLVARTPDLGGRTGGARVYAVEP